MAYVNVPIEVNADTLAQDAFDYLEANLPGWSPSPGQLDVLILEIASALAADSRELASDVPRSIFRYLGATLHGIPPIEAAPASVTSTWTMRDNAGYTIPAGTAVAIAGGDGTSHTFFVATAVTVPAGQAATAAGAVELIAEQDGSAPNNATGPVELVDHLEYVDAIALLGTPSDGVDAEDDDAYLGRLSDELRLLAPRPILPADFAVLARRVAGVYRATAIDGYNPANQTSNNERMVAVALVDDDGEAVAGPVKTAVDAYLQSLREANFVVHVIDPTYTTIDVTFTVRTLPEFTTADVDAAATAAVTEYLSPAAWGARLDPVDWRNSTVLRYTELVALLENVAGVDYVEALTFGIQGQALGSANVNLPGPAPLPRAGAINGTANAP